MTTNKLKEITSDEMSKTFPFCYEVVGGFPFLIQEAYIEQSFSPNCLLTDDDENDSKNQDLIHVKNLYKERVLKNAAECISVFEEQSKTIHNKMVLFKYKKGFFDEKTRAKIKKRIEHYDIAKQYVNDPSTIPEPRIVHVQEKIMVPVNNHIGSIIYLVDFSVLREPVILPYKIVICMPEPSSYAKNVYTYSYAAILVNPEMQGKHIDLYININSHLELSDDVWTLSRNNTNKKVYLSKERAMAEFINYIDDKIKDFNNIRDRFIGSL